MPALIAVVVLSLNDLNEIEGSVPLVTEKKDHHYAGGKLLASPPPGEEVVISGMAAVFPNSRDIQELQENLFKKVNMLVPSRKWDCLSDIPACSGPLSEIDKYDCGFFGVHERQSHSLDTMSRILQEKVVEAIFDAGLHPSEIEGSRTGVYIGVAFSENNRIFFDNLYPQSFAIMGTQRSMIAHRLSYFLKLKGPSVVIDTACSSSCCALENAYRAIRLGEIDNAIVGGTNLCLYSNITKQFVRLGVASVDGSCKPFEAQGSGYARSEAIAAIVLQRANNAKRIYAKLVHIKTNCDGFKEESITFPSKESQMELLCDLFEECGVDRTNLSFVEPHGTGTKAGDEEECAVLDAVLTSGRKTPLLIGSLKSSIGHTESVSGLCSIIKCIIAMETGRIPPNINFETPSDALTGLVEGRLKVVVEETPLEDENALMGVSSSGFGGVNVHVLLRRNPQTKTKSKDNLPRLVCVSGRTDEAVVVLLDQIYSNEMDTEYIKLLHDVFAKNISNHLYRGYAIVSQLGGISKSFSFRPHQEEPLYLVFGELNNWYEVGKQLMTLPIFHDSILSVQQRLTGTGVDIVNVFLDSRSLGKDSIPVIGRVAVQVAVIHLLDLVDVKPTGTSGCSFGVLAYAYRNKMLTLDETIRCAFIINESFLNNTELYDTCTDVKNGIVSEECNAPSKDDCDLCENLRNINKILLKILATEQSGIESMDYLTDVLAKDLRHHVDDVKPNSVILEIGDSFLGDMEEVSVVPLFKSGSKDCLVEFLAGLGRLYIKGYNPQISKLYPPIKFPVCRGTPMISPYVRWKHTREMFVPNLTLHLIRQAEQGFKRYRVELENPEWAFVANNVVDGKYLFPPMGYLYTVWETFVTMHGMPLKASRVSLKNCRFLRSIGIQEEQDLVFTVSILIGSGRFEVVEGNSVIVTGMISFLTGNELGTWNFNPDSITSNGLFLRKKEIYKELRLRGYNYSGLFRSIEDSDITFSKAHIKWQENWMAFIDNMLQLKILQSNDRSLRMPMFISNLDIVADVHCQMVKQTCKDSKLTSPDLPVYSDVNTGKITCGGITISGLVTDLAARKQNSSTPVLETYKFVPNFTELDLQDSVRVNAHIIIENTLVREFKVVELIDEFSDDEARPLTPIIKRVLDSEPLVQSRVKILNAKTLDVDVEVHHVELEAESNCVLVVASKIINRPEILQSAFSVIEEDGFVLSRERRCCDIGNELRTDISIITVHYTPFETIVLLQKRLKPRTTNYIKLDSSEDFSWLPKVQTALNKKSQEDLVLFAEKDPTNGILGMVNCLRKEPGLRDVKCVFIVDEDEEFNPNCKTYKDQLEKNMAVNVYKNGKWGTFRHFALDEYRNVESEHSFVDITEKGDLSCLRWIEGTLKHHAVPEAGKELVYVYYSSLNLRDVMIATGKIKGQQDPVLGIEFSGRDKRGNRVMGTTARAGLSNLLLADKRLMYSVPDHWTSEEAATVPMAYTTAIYAPIMCGLMKKGKSILIHSGSGSVGQAAINLALHYGCEVFATNIGDSHEESFEQMVYEGTNGRGVDIVLNSLTEDKLVASARCLAKGGRFLQIGKSDLESNRHLSLILFNKQASFHGVTLDETLNDAASREIRRLFRQLMEEGAVKPLERKVFMRDQIEDAFRFAATSSHIRKVLIKVREPEKQLVTLPSMQKISGRSRYYCDSEKVYVIIGGLGGIGLELADWLVLRGARKLVLTSRRGITTGYQHYRIKLWESYGVIVRTSSAPVVMREGCRQLIVESLELGRVAAVFNLAVVLADAIFENQTPESFAAAFEPKAVVTKHLDALTRTMCADLRGYGGQTNYGMANSVIERICEKRRRDGYSALSIQFGLVGEVGIIAEKRDDTELEMEGTVAQPISSCLQVLDVLLTQKDAAVTSSMVLAPKRGQRQSDNIVDAVINMLGIRDSKSVSPYSTLSQLGLDSLLSGELKLILERKFQIRLSTKELGTMSLTRLKQIQEENNEIVQDTGKSSESETIFGLSGNE